MKKLIEGLENEFAEAYWFLGLSYTTFGQVKRFGGDLSAATGAYSEALEIFQREDVLDYSWQAYALHARSEAHRRIAFTLFEQGRHKAGKYYEQLAFQDAEDSLSLCDQHRLREKYTANRRLGRLFHDQALRTTNPEKRLDLLNQAGIHFEQGLQVAVDWDNANEILENLTEITFLVDDRLEAIQGRDGHLTKEDIREGKRDIQKLRDAVDEYKDAVNKLTQLPVFEHLLELEEGAFRFEQKNYFEALEFYKQGYAGLASERGYGVARYRQHLGHLMVQIRKLNWEVGQTWAKEFIELWKNTEAQLPDGSKSSLANLQPELVEDMQLYLDTAFLDGLGDWE